MRSGLLAGFLAVSLMCAATEAASAPRAEKSPQPTAVTEVTLQKNVQAARPFSAVLRYGPGTTSTCQGLSDNSAAICLLFAFHVMQLSQKKVTETRL